MDKLDPELKTYYMQVKDEVKKEHTTYISQHPEIRQLLNDFLSTLLLEKPDDVYDYAQEYFSYFNTEKESAQHKPLVISGPSGAGKETLIEMLVKRFPDHFEVNVSYTTRKPTQDEKHGVHHFFVSPEEFTSEITKHSFIEHNEIDKNFYGTHKGYVKEVRERGRICIIQVDVYGAEKIAKTGADCNYIWIDPPSTGVLREKLAAEGNEKEEAINAKLKQIDTEMKEARKSNVYEKFLMYNDTQETFSRLISAINDMYPNLHLNA